MRVVVSVFGLVFAGLGVLISVTGVSNFRSYVAKKSEPMPVRTIPELDGAVEFEDEEYVASSYCIRHKTTNSSAGGGGSTWSMTGEK
jgi:hypothetical protein